MLYGLVGCRSLRTPPLLYVLLVAIMMDVNLKPVTLTRDCGSRVIVQSQYSRLLVGRYGGLVSVGAKSATRLRFDLSRIETLSSNVTQIQYRSLLRHRPRFVSPTAVSTSPIPSGDDL